jgi:hypothetical protein
MNERKDVVYERDRNILINVYCFQFDEAGQGLLTNSPQIGFCGIVIRRVESIISLHRLDS